MPGTRPELHLDTLLDPQSPDLLHEQEDAVPPPLDRIVDLCQLQACKVLQRCTRSAVLRSKLTADCTPH